MEIIFNELSLQNPPKSREVGVQAFTAFISKLEAIQKVAKRSIPLRTTFEFKTVYIAENYSLVDYLSKNLKADERKLFTSLVSKKPIRREPPYYYYKGIECEGLGMAYEEGLFAISFNHDKEWNDDNYTILKYKEIENKTVEEVCTIKHFGAVNLARINEHLAENSQIQVYDCDSKFPPRDAQTILCNPKEFRMTVKRCQGRKIYQHISEKTYWYVDNSHYGCNKKDGKAAHLEVFDRHRNHVGIADIRTGKIKEDSKENKTISI